VIWDISKGESFGKQEKKEENMKHGVLEKSRKSWEVLVVENHRLCLK
jgi:hypothetical protein